MGDARDNQRLGIAGMWPYGADILGNGPGTPRIRAISVVWAAQAAQQWEVIRYRTDVLGGSLLPADEIDTWLKTRPESKNPYAYWLHNIPVERLKRVDDGSYIIPAEIMAEAAGNRGDDNELPSARTRILLYATPDHEWLSETIRSTGGILDTLRTIARDLVDLNTQVAPADIAVQKLWKEEHAATFVLTGYVPLVPEEAFPLPVRSGRRQTDKHLQLAAFTAQREAEGVSLAQRLTKWNERFPQWRYKQVTNFGWDSRQALRRLLPSSDPNQEEQEQGRDLAAEGGIGIEKEYTAQEKAIAHAELARQHGGKHRASWTADTGRLLDEAQAREDDEKSKKGAG